MPRNSFDNGSMRLIYLLNGGIGPGGHEQTLGKILSKYVCPEVGGKECMERVKRQMREKSGQLRFHDSRSSQ